MSGADDWLEAIVSAKLTERHDLLSSLSRPLVLIDGISLSQQGGNGKAWVLHSRYNPQAGFIVRAGWNGLADSPAWRDEQGKAMPILPLRLVVQARDGDVTKIAVRKTKGKARKNGSSGDPRSVEAARYMIIATSLDAQEYPGQGSKACPNMALCPPAAGTPCR